MASTSQDGLVSNGARWGGRILSGLPVLLMLVTGSFGLFSPAAAAVGFAKYGYPAGALQPIIITEIFCVVLYVIPRTSFLGAILLTGYLGGATATHVRLSETLAVFPIIVGIMVWAGLYLRDARLRALVPLRRPATE
jgi:hypothetical protein